MEKSNLGTSKATLSKLSMLSMLGLFAGTFFYHTALGLGIIPPVLGGYVTIASAALGLPFLCMIFLSILSTHKIKTSDAVFLTFILIFSTVVSYHITKEEYKDTATQHTYQIVNLLACYLIFRNIDFTRTYMKKTLIICILAMSAIIISLSSGGRFYIKLISSTPDIVASYQTFAVAYLCPAVVLISQVKRLKYRALAFSICLVCLYINSSRSEFVMLGIFYVAFEMCRSRYRLISPLLSILFGVIAIAGLLYLDPDSSSNRIANLVNLSEDNSSRVRNELAQDGISKIIENPIFGDYGNYEKGHYIHNILSGWQELGLLGFAFYCAMLLIPLVHISARVFIAGDRSRQAALCFSMLSSTIILLIFGKYFTYQLIAVALGIYASVNKSYLTDRAARAELTRSSSSQRIFFDG
ncbi:O-antigen ligase [Pseudomonas sp. BBP2017]|uniref:O-antigen ligase family protein n=1 Tax=Pseudomonas sp. BBP2017 TaxID=2109731 RepID=UPI0011B1CEC7|nr:O-antigen ligase family protein [Pseudomonas sp. BBP2017]